MTDTMMEISKADKWAEQIAKQQRSGVSVKQFCKDHGLTECSFYAWRKRLRKEGAVRFALVDRGRRDHRTEVALELVLVTGERLRIGDGVDITTLRMVLETLRA